MLDPIIDDSIKVVEKQFKTEQVDRFRNGSGEALEHPTRHYSQSASTFDREQMKKALTKLSIPLDTKSIIFGGYTGELAVCLRELGVSVIFTDPMNEWVENAKKAGFEAYKFSAEELPGDLLSRVRLAASFECYFPFMTASTVIYTTLRLLALEHGGLFCESKRTISDITNEVQAKRLKQFKSTLTPFIKAYGIKVNFTDVGDVRLFHFYAPSNDLRETIIRDCACIKTLYDNFPNETVLDNNAISTLSKLTRMSEEDLTSAIYRYDTAFQARIKSYGSIANYFPRDMFQLFSKRYYMG